MALPGCEAWIVQVPAARMVTVVELTVQTGEVSDAKLTTSPDEAVALTVNGTAPNVLPPSALNVIVWLVCASAVGINPSRQTIGRMKNAIRTETRGVARTPRACLDATKIPPGGRSSLCSGATASRQPNQRRALP